MTIETRCQHSTNQRKGRLFLLIAALALAWATITIVDAIVAVCYRIRDLVTSGEPGAWRMALHWTNHLTPLFEKLDIGHQLDNSQVSEEARTGPTVVGVTHPSSVGVNRYVLGLMNTIDGPHRFSIKQELMLWPIGWGLWFAGAAIPTPRSDRETSVERLSKARIETGTAVILIEGTRPRWFHEHGRLTRLIGRLRRKEPRPKNTIVHARKKLREMGMGRIATSYMGGLWRDTGITTLLRANPHARFVIQISFSEVHEEGFKGAFDMVGRSYYDKLVELDRDAIPLDASDEERLRFWNELGAAVWRYISAVRIGAHGIDKEFHFDWDDRRVTLPQQS